MHTLQRLIYLDLNDEQEEGERITH